MGFGLLFISYLFLYSFPYKTLDITPDFLGFIIAFLGIRLLAEYGCGWEKVKSFMYALLPVSFITLVLQILGLTPITLPFMEIWNYVYIAFLLVYNILLLMAIYGIANDTGVISIKVRAQRNLVLTVLYYGIMLLISLPISSVQEAVAYLSDKYAFGLIMYLFGYTWLILNSILIFSCYMRICREGDEEMPEKESKLFKKKDKEKEEE